MIIYMERERGEGCERERYSSCVQWDTHTCTYRASFRKRREGGQKCR